MVRQRAPSAASNNSSNLGGGQEQELDSMYDYLAKIILLGPSGSGKSCLLHRFVKDEWRVLSSQTIGVEFASKIVKVGTGARRKRIKLQLWDTAGTERFRSVSRSYYRGAAGALLVYDITSASSFSSLPNFLNDARALASPELTLLLVGNKVDCAEGDLPDLNVDDPLPSSYADGSLPPPGTPGSVSTKRSFTDGIPNGSVRSSTGLGIGSANRATEAPEGREVQAETASAWAAGKDIPVAVETSARSGENVEDVFNRLARMILTKIELGEVDPDDPQSGIQYGDSGGWDADGGSVKSGIGHDDGLRSRRRKRGRANTWVREWEEVFRLDVPRRRRGGCC